MHKTIGYKKKYTRYDEKNKIRRKSKKYYFWICGSECKDIGKYSFIEGIFS